MNELAVLVPVLNRPANVAPLVRSFLTSGCPGILVFITETADIDERRAINSLTSMTRVEEVVSHDAHTWPEKINLGYESVEADWYLCAADDVEFDYGWWGATEQLRADPKIGVIGTNDSRTGSGNQAVAAGEHTCHPLVRGSYAERGTWDQPGQIVHEGYAHWFCDNEIVATAKQRAAWAYCAEAVVHHLHPYWDQTIRWDATYQEGELGAMGDAEVWGKRSRMYL